MYDDDNAARTHFGTYLFDRYGSLLNLEYGDFDYDDVSDDLLGDDDGVNDVMMMINGLLNRWKQSRIRWIQYQLSQHCFVAVGLDVFSFHGDGVGNI